MERVLPKTLDYTDVLPLAVESRARRRTFFPVNGQSFASDGANIIRIDLSADALLDTQHSYLRFNFTPSTNKVGMDFSGGHGFIKRLRIEQSGVVLEDINSYNRLMGAIVLPCQSGVDHHKERSMTEFVRPQGGGTTLGSTTTQAASVVAMTANEAGTNLARGGLHNDETQLTEDQEYTFTIPLNSGLLNCEKLVPLMLMSAPLTIELELSPSGEPYIQRTALSAGYTISNVRYIANLVEVGGDVAQQLRMVQEMSGGVLTLAGQTYRHFTGTVSAGAGDKVVNVPARVKSMKSLFFAVQDADGTSSRTKYTCSYGGNITIKELQLKIGSVVYPPTPIQCNFGDGTNGYSGAGNSKGEALMELAKAWGNVGSTKGLGQLDFLSYAAVKDSAPTTGGLLTFAPFGIDLEAFQRVAIESGVNTADRSLPISLIINTVNNAANRNVDAFVLADALFYINADGSMSVSV
jgi:hypothetical protein